MIKGVPYLVALHLTDLTFSYIYVRVICGPLALAFGLSSQGTHLSPRPI